jgi:cytoskeleton protein RodZ
VFARALASSVCRTLKIDPQPVLDRLPQTHAPRLVHDNPGLNEPFRAPGDGDAPGWADQLTKPVFLAVFALLLGALVLIFLPGVRTGEAASAKADAAAPLTTAVLPAGGATEVPVAASAETVPVPMPGPQSAAYPALVPVAAVGPAAAPTRQAGTGAAATVPKAAAPPAQSASSAGRAAAPAASPVAGSVPVSNRVVVFRTSGPSWIEVTDGQGAVALRRLMAAGESAGASGNLPLTVTIGSVNVTSVQVRGKPYDLARFSRDNVARFEVK